MSDKLFKKYLLDQLILTEFEKTRHKNICEMLLKRIKNFGHIVIVRYQIEDLEEQMDQIMLFPSKEVMMNELRSHPLSECTLVNPNYRYITLFFYFLSSNGSLAREIRHIIEQLVCVHKFCRQVTVFNNRQNVSSSQK